MTFLFNFFKVRNHSFNASDFSRLFIKGINSFFRIHKLKPKKKAHFVRRKCLPQNISDNP